ncbi:MAG TPA: porin family protein [Cyclobacteriaceae bacterium]|jgi:hypothetical protein|nr:porin family protein [Cyclobacteriaceae bacterium]
MLAIIFGNVFGQGQDCEPTLNQATAEFDAGRFYSLPSILKPCLDNGFSKEQKVRAYLLLTQSYLILNDPIAAENSYLKLLEADPEYVANPTRDPVDVYYLSKKFTTTPVFTPSFFGGANVTFPRILYSTNTSATPTQSDIKYKIGYQVGGNLDWNLTDRWSIGVGLRYSFRSFRTDYDNSYSGDLKSFTEKQNWIDVPLYVKYTKDTGVMRPFGYIGLAANLLVGDNLTVESTDLNSPIPGGRQFSTGADQNITNKRFFFNRSVVIGGGIKYKVGKNFLFVDARYMLGLNNIAKNIYTDRNGQLDRLNTNYQYASDLFKVDNLSLSVGFIKPLYDPRKKKPVVAGLLQKLGIKKKKNK